MKKGIRDYIDFPRIHWLGHGLVSATQTPTTQSLTLFPRFRQFGSSYWLSVIDYFLYSDWPLLWFWYHVWHPIKSDVIKWKLRMRGYVAFTVSIKWGSKNLTVLTLLRIFSRFYNCTLINSARQSTSVKFIPNPRPQIKKKNLTTTKKSFNRVSVRKVSLENENRFDCLALGNLLHEKAFSISFLDDLLQLFAD